MDKRRYMHGKRRRRSPLKQDKIPSLTDKELDESLKRMNAKIEMHEAMKSMGGKLAQAKDGEGVIYKEGDIMHTNVPAPNTTWNPDAKQPVQKEWARTNKNWKKMKK